MKTKEKEKEKTMIASVNKPMTDDCGKCDEMRMNQKQKKEIIMIVA